MLSGSEVVTKRLHVSGLTPQISAADLTLRFSSFGKVKALDGLGKLDGVGQPRPYAYLTLETTKAQLAKCLNLLSGTTWKGARLRIGEAKPDFRERIKRENELANVFEVRPHKRRRPARGAQGKHAADMSLVSPTSLRPGWRVTPLGRLVRPIRIRPLRPLLESGSPAKQKRTAAMKRKTFPRARIRKLDPEEWGSTYLTGIMLESESGIVLPDKAHRNSPAMVDECDKELASADGHSERSPSPQRASPLLPPHPGTDAIFDKPEAARDDADFAMDLSEEKNRSLALLNSLFGSGEAKNRAGDRDLDDWGGAESLSDIDVNIEQDRNITVTNQTGSGEEGEIEYVPRTRPRSISRSEEDGNSCASFESTSGSQTQESAAKHAEPDSHSPQAVYATKLKEMFAPGPEHARFSILGNLDLELDEELPTISAPLPPPLPSPVPEQSTVSAPSSTMRPSMNVLDAKYPFFFPHSLLPNSSLKLKLGDPRDIFSGKINFFRTETDEEIRTRWESRKVELTRDWKRRHREAVKNARRRGGIQD